MMNDGYKVMFERAMCDIAWGFANTLSLVRVEYSDMPPRVSIVGNHISPAAIDCWRQQGAKVRLILKLKRKS